MGLIVACYLGLYGILSGLTKSTDHPSTSKMAIMIDPILPIPSILGYWAIILGSFGGPGGWLHIHTEN